MFPLSRASAVYIILGLVVLMSATALYFIFQDRGGITDLEMPSNAKSKFSQRVVLPSATILPPSAVEASPATTSGGGAALAVPNTNELVTNFLEKIRYAALEIQQPPAILNTNEFDAKKSTATSGGLILHLEPDELTFLYPKPFLNILQDIAQTFISSEDGSYVALPEIKTDADVRMIEEKLVDVLHQVGIYNSEQVARAKETIRFILPRLQLNDLRARAQGLSVRKKIINQNGFQELAFVAQNVPQFLNNIYTNHPRLQPAAVPSRGFFFGDLISQLKSALVPTAQAVCGYCYSSPVCAQEGVSPPATRGSETFRAACTCTGCLSGLGCTDGCGNGVAVIFDPVTFICGCGI